jgi:hypothetical protein
MDKIGFLQIQVGESIPINRPLAMKYIGVVFEE